MKSHTKSSLRAMPAAQVQIALPVQGVLLDVRYAFLGPCIDAGQKVLAAMMEADQALWAGVLNFWCLGRFASLDVVYEGSPGLARSGAVGEAKR